MSGGGVGNCGSCARTRREPRGRAFPGWTLGMRAPRPVIALWWAQPTLQKSTMDFTDGRRERSLSQVAVSRRGCLIFNPCHPWSKAFRRVPCLQLWASMRVYGLVRRQGCPHLQAWHPTSARRCRLQRGLRHAGRLGIGVAGGEIGEKRFRGWCPKMF